MDVGDPSNFIRILNLYDSNLTELKKDFLVTVSLIVKQKL